MSVVTLTRAGIAINGAPLFLLAGQLHYFRYPRAEWRDQLLLARAAGLNTIDTVIPWNLHEPRPGEFDFSGEADLPGYLDLCAELGLYAIVRPGPYICAEWENGGFPAWLTSRPGLELRVDNSVYMEPLRRWFDTLLPLLASRQIGHGDGTVILCQIENEHWASGRYGHDDHQRTLAQEATGRGVEVPQYTCMGPMNEWAEFRNGWSGIAEKLVATRAVWPDNPMIVSELWSGWFDNWGASKHTHKSPAKLDTTLHQLLAVGSSGWSHWMWAGGTNFGFWGGRTVGGDTVHMTTSYDYDAPVSEYGGLTDKFFVARRHHLFCATLGAPLAAMLADGQPGGIKVIAPAAVAGRGEAGSAPYRTVRAAADAPARWRSCAATFLNNPASEGQTHQVFLPDGTHLQIEVEPWSIKPVFANLPLGDSPWGVLAHTCRILGFWPGDTGDILVLYGSEGEAGEVRIGCDDRSEVSASSDDNRITPTTADATARLRFWIGSRPGLARVEAGGRTLQVVLLTTAYAERCWVLPGKVVCGPDLLVEEDGKSRVAGNGSLPYYLIDSNTVRLMDGTAFAPRQQVIWHSAGTGAAALHHEAHAVTEATLPSPWKPLDAPRSMDELGCLLGYGWYRGTVHLRAPETVTVAAPWLNDRAQVIVNGEDCGWLGVHPHGPRFTLTLPLAQGSNDLRLLVDNLGRFNYGSNTGERKGLLDTLYRDGRQHDITGGWVALWQEAVFAGEAIANAKPWAVRADASDVRLDQFAFGGSSVWLLREIETVADRFYLLHITGDRNPGALFVNGVNVARFSRHHGGGYIKLDITEHLRPGRNVLALNIQNYSAFPWQATMLEYGEPLQVAWSFRPGVAMADEAATAGSGPCFHRATFAYDRVTHGEGPFKLALPGCSKGQIWLNGHNVGRFWNVGPQEWYKLPVSWLRDTNELLILDESGATLAELVIVSDAAGAAALLRTLL